MTVEFRGNFLPPEMLVRYQVGQRVFVDSVRYGKRTGVITAIDPQHRYPYLMVDETGECHLGVNEIVSDLPASNRWEDYEPWLEET